jgi:hypothetical protein
MADADDSLVLPPLQADPSLGITGTTPLPQTQATQDTLAANVQQAQVDPSSLPDYSNGLTGYLQQYVAQPVTQAVAAVKAAITPSSGTIGTVEWIGIGILVLVGVGVVGYTVRAFK